MSQKRLYRSETDRQIAGVCGGLADYFNVDVTLVRIIFVLLLLSAGPGLLIYIALWIAVPNESVVKGKPLQKAKNDELDPLSL
jgi:phage shock protein C